MNTQKSQFNRNTLIILGILFVLSLAAFIYMIWTLEAANMQWWEMLFTIILVSIPFVLLYGSVYVLLIGWHEHSKTGQVSTRLGKVIHWMPRIAAILIILFISMFSFDVFEMEGTLFEKIGGFLIHNIPSIALIVLLAFAWNRPVIGFVAFVAAAVFFAAFFVRGVENLLNLVIFVFPILLIGLLFYADWKWLDKTPPAESMAA